MKMQKLMLAGMIIYSLSTLGVSNDYDYDDEVSDLPLTKELFRRHPERYAHSELLRTNPDYKDLIRTIDRLRAAKDLAVKHTQSVHNDLDKNTKEISSTEQTINQNIKNIQDQKEKITLLSSEKSPDLEKAKRELVKLEENAHQLKEKLNKLHIKTKSLQHKLAQAEKDEQEKTAALSSKTREKGAMKRAAIDRAIIRYDVGHAAPLPARTLDPVTAKRA